MNSGLRETTTTASDHQIPNDTFLLPCVLNNKRHHQEPSTSGERVSQEQIDDLDPTNRPKIQIQPRGIGPVIDLHENDVLCGRGGRINGHYGNIQFRKLCSDKRQPYYAKGIKKIQKAHIAASVVRRIRSLSPPGRFLKQDASTGQWFDIGCAKAMTKVGQAIREHTAKEEESNCNEFAPITCHAQESVKVQFKFHGPLYPWHQSIDPLNNGQDMSGLTDPCFGGPIYQNPITNNLESTEDNSSFGCAFQVDRSGSCPTPKRFSAVSAISELSRMSELMRQSVQSDLSDDMSASTSRRMSGGSLSLLRQSVLSDISDCMSAMNLDDYGSFRPSIAGDYPSTQEGIGATSRRRYRE